MSAAFATAGSFEIYLTNRCISRVLSSIASSIFTSMMRAPSSICFAAIWSASSYFPSAISRANFLDPATFVLSPTLVKLLTALFTMTASNPLTFSISPAEAAFSSLEVDDVGCDVIGSCLGLRSATANAISLIWSGLVPQHPPTTLTRPRTAISRTCAAISLGLWSYPPISLGSPALG